ncbi:hypothetical protein O3M35_003838 [Rhynocoris fuscipes]|uniref:Uncharacterized protein n=1 Tax=Rhynocoris fuscipes TaxID=488301 RepID=A0AAW1CM89_9HEMI
MYYQQYNVYKPGWYTGNAFPQTGTGIIQHPSSPSNVQTSPYVSCMHEEQSAWGQIFQTPSPPHHHHHHHHNHHNGTAGPPTILQTAGPPPPPSSAHPPPPTQSSELWDDAAVLAAAAVAAQNNSPTGQHQQQHQQSSQQHQQSSQQQHTSPNCNPQIVDHHVRAQPPRSPFEWMKKPSYHSQPNPGWAKLFLNCYNAIANLMKKIFGTVLFTRIKRLIDV